MSLIKNISVFILLAAVATNLAAAEPLRENFQSPPNSAKPHTWWHWMNGYVTAEGITKDLEAMQRAGVGGFQAFQIEFGMDAGPVKYLSSQWRELMTHSIQEAERLGLEVCFHNCAGWSSSGGPWITPEYAMQEVVWTQQQVQQQVSGAKKVDVKLPRPKNLRDDYFRDIAVLAFPTPKSERGDKTGFRIDNWKAKAGYERDNDIQADTRKVDSGDLIELNSIIDLTEKMDASGRLRWNAPKGDWTIVRFGHAVCGLRNRPAPKEGRGNECDKMSKAAAQWHWKNTVQKVIDDAGPLTGKSFNSVLIDSYETGQQNWTNGFDDEFQRRMGYDVIKHLPAVTGRVINDLEYTERFLWDFRRVVADLWTENYYGHFAKMCHENGLLLACEPYGLPGNLDNFQVADRSDIPMGEWWARKSSGLHNSSSKMAASAAHTNGRRFVGAEAFTAGRAEAAFVNHPYVLKAQGDYFFCKGINRFYFHSFVHQPWGDDVLPGMTMAVWGFQNHRNNTWYEQGRAWNEYLARSQYMLQEGTFQADLCYYPGENAPQVAALREGMKPAVPAGYDYDTISKNNLMKLTVEDGYVVLPGLMKYRLLVMPEGPVRLDVLEHIQGLVKAGAHVVWAKPQLTPGLQNYPKADQVVRAAADRMWGDCDGKTVTEASFGEGKIYWTDSLSEILASMDVLPDVEFQSAQPIAPTLYEGNGYAWIHRKIESADVYLISNQQDVARQVEVVCRVTDRAPQLWNAETGSVEPAPIYQSTQDGRTLVRLFLEPAESVFVVFDEQAKTPSVVDVLHNGKTPFTTSKKDSQVLEIHKAVYGDLNGDSSRQVEVTKALKKRVSSHSLRVNVDNKLAGRDPASGTKKQLRVVYSLGDKKSTILVDENEMLNLGSETEIVAATPEPAVLSKSEKGSVLTAMETGDYELVYSDGSRRSVQISSIPKPVDLSRDWNLNGPDGWGPSQIELEQLISWADHSDPDLKYFSGTAVYTKQFDVPADRLGDDHAVTLDLGEVQVMADVILNGKNLGIQWKPPFKIDATGLLKGKNNQLEVRVTNLWVNRMIGDEQHPATDRYIPGRKPQENLIEKIPGWLKSGKPRPATERKSFTTARFYDQDSSLVESGLIGPVQLHFGIRKTISRQ